AGFVGKGMLTAAVCGDVFASPSVDAVLAGIQAVTGKAGCLLVVKNYTGDRLNFGLAAARARELGVKVNMVVVQDDIAIPELGRPRGVAGTLFVHKISGAVAENGGTLEEVTDAAERAAQKTISIGMSLSSCTMPGSIRDDRISEGNIELGLGIHGEPGAEQIPFQNAKDAIAKAAAKLEPRLSGFRYVALVNNLGSTTALEMAVLTEELRNSVIGDKISHVIGPAHVMTALDMHGFSVSLFPLSDTDQELLEANTPLMAWPGMQRLVQPMPLPLPSSPARAAPHPSRHGERARIIRTACHALISAEAELNSLDAKTGDGDTGTTLATAAHALEGRLDDLPLADLTELFQAISRELTQTMGGSSGVLLAILFSAAGEASAKGEDPINALKFGMCRVQEVGGARLGDRTLIDALAPALESLDDGIGAAATAARAGATSTAKMLKAHAGRAAYVGEQQLEGNVDPGAEAVALLFEHISAAPI
ncbi:MAG: dihydroxyacetone kinase subunit DhaK, partial [Myxococcota bacterium]